MSNQEQALQAARALSYINQGEEDIIPEEKLGEMVTFPLGFQPSGITHTGKIWYHESNKNAWYEEVLVVNYYAPAVCIATLFFNKNKLQSIANEWIRGAKHGIFSVRLFPDTPQGGNNRGICAFLDGSRNLYIVRNESRNLFLHTPPKGENKRWTLTKKIDVPPRSTNECLWIKSIAYDFRGPVICTIESNEVDSARLRSYIMGKDYSLTPTDLDFELPINMYGIDMHAEKLWFVTGFRSKAKPGIYSWQEDDAALKLVIPDIYGNGIVLLKNGSALVTEYGESRPGPFGGGQPGSLTYIPASMFEK